jgi:hypothetical protein
LEFNSFSWVFKFSKVFNKSNNFKE